MNMKKLLFILGIVVAMTTNAQTKDYVGKWELRMIVSPQGDTTHIKQNDARYITYNFEYNNTFTSYVKAKNEEATGRWGYDFGNKTIKIKNPVYTTSRVKIGDYDLVVKEVTPNWLAELRQEKKKEFSTWVYLKVK